MKKLNLTESIMSDLDALAREHSDREEFILKALSDKYFNLKQDKDTIEFLNIIFDGAHKDLDMEPTQVTEVLPKSADAGEYIADFEKSKAPQFKGKSKKKRKEMAIAAFMAANKGKMKKEDILKAVTEVLAEGTVEINTTDGTEKTATPEQRQQIQNARRAGASISYRKKGDLGEDIDLGHEDDEPHMIKSELYKIAKYALELYKMVDKFEGKGEIDFPAWWQSKITKANAMIGSAKHYLEFELTEPAMDQAVAGSEVPVAEKLDPVGHEDKDINNDGKVDKTDKYLKNRRVKIGQAIASHKK